MVAASIAIAEDEAPVITGFRGGKIEWKSKANEQYRVEWAWKLDGSNTVWSTNWVAHQEVAGTGTTMAAWSAYDVAGTSGLDARGFSGAVFDGRYVYLVPYYDGVPRPFYALLHAWGLHE